MLEMDFKSNSTPQNKLVRWGLYPLIYCKLTLSLVDVGLSTITSQNSGIKNERYFFND